MEGNIGGKELKSPDIQGKLEKPATTIVIQREAVGKKKLLSLPRLSLTRLAYAYAILYFVFKAIHYVNDVKFTIDLLKFGPGSEVTLYNTLHLRVELLLGGGPYAHKDNFVRTHPKNHSVAQNLDIGLMKKDCHLWASYLFFRTIEYTFAWFLIMSLYRKNWLGIFAWLSFSIPVLFFHMLQVLIDIFIGNRDAIYGEQVFEILIHSVTIGVMAVYWKYSAFLDQRGHFNPSVQVNLGAKSNKILLP